LANGQVDRVTDAEAHAEVCSADDSHAHLTVHQELYIAKTVGRWNRTSHRPELQRLGKMTGRDIVSRLEIRDRARDGTDPVVPARAEAETGDRGLDETDAGAIERTAPCGKRRRQFRVRP